MDKYYFQRTTKRETSVFNNQYAKTATKWVCRYRVGADNRNQARKELEIEIALNGYCNQYCINASN